MDNQRLSTLLAGTAQRDASAFSQLYQEFSPTVYGIALSVVKEPHTAAELSIDDMAKMIERSGKDPSYINLTILPYPIATGYDFQRMDRIGNYENWYVYLGAELGLLNEHSVDAESMEDYLGHPYESERGLNI